jgi:hypothetical protein
LLYNDILLLVHKGYGLRRIAKELKMPKQEIRDYLYSLRGERPDYELQETLRKLNINTRT